MEFMNYNTLQTSHPLVLLVTRIQKIYCPKSKKMMLKNDIRHHEKSSKAEPTEVWKCHPNIAEG